MLFTLDLWVRAAILSGAVLLSTSTILAQEFRFGGGYNGSNVRDVGTEQWVGRAGYQGGVDLTLGKAWFLRPGVHLQVRNLNYTLAGIDQNGQPFGAEVEYRYTERSLRVPLLAGRRLLDTEGPLNVYVVAGPTALFNLNADLDNDQLEVETSRTQWYIGAGAGLEFSFLFVEGGYDVAMTDVFQGEGFSTDPRVNQVTLTAGVRLRLAQ